MHIGADRNLADPAGAPAAPECACPCGCSEPTPSDTSTGGDNLFAQAQSGNYLGDYLIIHGTGSPDQ